MISDRIQSVNFAAHTSEEIKALAVKRINNPETYDQLLHPNTNGLCDPCLGACEKDEICDTCGMTSMKCPGHFGYIQLPLTVYHPLFFKLMVQIIRGSCFKCHKLIAKKSRGQLFIRQCHLLDKGYLVEAASLCDLYYSFLNESAKGTVTDHSVEESIFQKIEEYYNDVTVNNQNKKNGNCSKNLIKCKQDLIKTFMKDHLLGKSKECPHCKSPLRAVRSEYNTRIFFKSAGHRLIKKLKDPSQRIKKDDNVTSSIKEELINIKQEPINNYEEPPEERMDQTDTHDDLLDGGDEEEEIEENSNEGNIQNNKFKSLDQEYVTPEEVKNHLLRLWEKDAILMKCLFGSFSGPETKKRVTTPEILFLDVLAVPPTRFRPQAFMGEKRFENPQTANLVKVLWHCKLVEELLSRLKTSNKEEVSEYIPVVLSTTQGYQKKGGGAISVPGKSYKEQLQNAWAELQTNINSFMDSTLNKLVRDPTPGVRQLLEKKEGLFRKHMMGKRVNYACRSVISPDPYINTDEIGIPKIFASKLTYCQTVTPWNISELTQMVINGPNKYPGAVMVELENGRRKILSSNEKERKAIAKQLLSSSVAKQSVKGNFTQEKKVYRHLLNGDILLLNRQPTLHRPSIMAHKAKVLPKERTLRLHYANCKSYNADFDGDEMNAHFPQNELGRSEAYNLVSTNYNYLSPKDGKPLAGLIQDHIVSGVLMTSRDRFFNREEYQQLVYSSLIDKQGRIKVLPPCIMKPVTKWSGKQVVSTVILNVLPKDDVPLNMTGNKAKLSDHSWPKKGKGNGRKQNKEYHVDHANDPFLTESQVIIRDGELMTGILDKTQYGAAAFGLIHYMYELYSGVVSGLLLSAFARLFTTFLQHAGFTLGVEDILVLPHAEKKRLDIITNGRQCGDESALEALNLEKCDRETLKDRLQEAHHTNEGYELKQLDLSMKSRTDNINNQINTACMKGLLKKFPDNCLQLIVQSGAKGSSVNCMQISCLLGQIELEGRRPPLTTSGRSLPSFVPYDTSPRAGGFVDGRFLTGIKPQEYFFHCMAGREGLVDTAVKTSRSGYLQRCLIKHLEALYVQYDMTVRDGDGSIVQFLYGEDSIDVLKSQYLHEKQYKGILENHTAYKSLLKPREVSSSIDCSKAPKHQRKCERWKRRCGIPFSSLYYHDRKSPYLLFENDNRKKLEKKYPSKERKMGRTKVDMKLLKRWTESIGPTKEDYLKKCRPCPDPILSVVNPSCSFGAVSELFDDNVKSYIDKNEGLFLGEDEEQSGSRKISSGEFLPLMLIKYLKSLVEPGEAVGLLAAQSIGEPSTQMTLNTFHFAGRGEMNVTLGIPRLREILMTASKIIKTPQMDVMVQPGQEEKANAIARSMNKLKVVEVLRDISVHESLRRSELNGNTRCREFRVRLDFLPQYTYEEEYVVTPEQLMDYIETSFIKRIAVTIAKMIQTKQKQKLVRSQASKEPTTTTNQNGEEDEQNTPPEEVDDEVDVSDEEDRYDGDATDAKSKSRQTQHTSYDDPDARREEMNEVNNENNDYDMVDPSNIQVKSEPFEHEEQWYADFTINGTNGEEEKNNDVEETPLEIRKQNVLRRDRHVTKYEVDENNEWCDFTLQFGLSGSKIMLVSVIEKLAKKSVVHEARGINRAILSESKNMGENGRWRLKTEGVNIHELWKYPDVLDLNSVYCNDIHAVAKTYGIEAARRTIIKEVQDVFKVYGIPIDHRHLSLIGDYMTFEGVYKPFNRVGIETNPFPFQKMSFETSTHFLRSATAFGQPDHLGSPSSRIVVGRVIGSGTGMCDMIPKLSV